jgi:peptide/nickel transport system ATP-binding protein/oligopeptide transport system ATP-binding protein
MLVRAARVAMQSEPLLEVRDLSKSFESGGFFSRRRQTVRAVDGISFRIEANETLALVGESGCGKSTTGRLLLRLIEADRGSIRFGGTELMTLSAHEMQSRRRDLQLVFQDPYGSLNPRMTVREVLKEPLLVHKVSFGRRADAIVDEILDHVALPRAYARRYPHEFSGGQRQRIAIARALILQPRLIVCDEPVSALDVSVQAQILNLLDDLKQRFGLSYLFVSHDLGVVRRMADRIAVMYLGRIVETAAAGALFDRPSHPYTQALMNAIPAPHPRLRRTQSALEGDVPSPTEIPPGCRFHTRCLYAVDRCRQELPQPTIVAPGHAVACHRVHELPRRAPLAANDAAGQPNERVRRLHARFSRPLAGDAVPGAAVAFARIEEQTR